MYYWICEECGAWLDIGEKCDCMKEPTKAEPAAASVVMDDDRPLANAAAVLQNTKLGAICH